MPDEPTLSTAAFGRAFRAFLEQSVSEQATEEPPFVTRLAEHLGANPRELPIVAEQFSAIEHPNVQVALDVWARGEGRSAELLGMSAEEKRYAGLGMADLISPVRGGLMGDRAPQPGPVDYANVAVARGRTMTCVQHGLYLLRDGERPLAVLVNGPTRFGEMPQVSVEVMSPEPRGDYVSRRTARGHAPSQRLPRSGPGPRQPARALRSRRGDGRVPGLPGDRP